MQQDAMAARPYGAGHAWPQGSPLPGCYNLYLAVSQRQKAQLRPPHKVMLDPQREVGLLEEVCCHTLWHMIIVTPCHHCRTRRGKSASLRAWSSDRVSKAYWSLGSYSLPMQVWCSSSNHQLSIFPCHPRLAACTAPGREIPCMWLPAPSACEYAQMMVPLEHILEHILEHQTCMGKAYDPGDR